MGVYGGVNNLHKMLIVSWCTPCKHMINLGHNKSGGMDWTPITPPLKSFKNEAKVY